MDNDYELVYLAQEYNEDANEMLYKKYRDLIYSKSYKYYFMLKKCGLELEDVIQETFIAFYDAIRCFNQDSNCNFSTFVNVCITNRLNTLFTRYSGNKNILLNNAISIDNIYNIVFDEDCIPENMVISLDNETNLYNKIKCRLSNFEDIVFELRINNFSNIEIMSILDVNYKNVCNAINRIKNKINDIIG